jgi:imidazolonepropionase-like amidohydrolase
MFMPSLSSSRIAFLLFLLVALITGGGGLGATAQSSTSSERTVVYENGHVWDGGGFVNRPLVVRDGQFVDAPTEADTTVDLNGGYVIPPFGDAHTHNLGAGGISIRMEEMYLRQGIFYAADLTNPHSAITRELDYLDPPRSIREHFGREQTLDVAYTLGGLTATGSHPAPIMERIYGDDVDSTWSLAGDAYWFLDTRADVREKWPRYIAQGPDLVKVYLMDVGRKLDAGDAERGDRAGCGFGLCPEELRAVVQRAHKAGKRVSAHVNTAADVRLALEAGVDELAHLPLGNDGISVEDSAPYRLRNSTIQRIGEKNMVVVPTALLMVEDVETFPADTLREEIALQRRQVRALHKAGAHLALSGHNWRTTALREATYFHTHEFFDARTLLRLWTTTTSQAIFPDRQIGRLTPGYEASFLVLPKNPIEDFGAVREVRRRIKQGHRLALPQSEGS